MIIIRSVKILTKFFELVGYLYNFGGRKIGRNFWREIWQNITTQVYILLEVFMYRFILKCAQI